MFLTIVLIVGKAGLEHRHIWGSPPWPAKTFTYILTIKINEGIYPWEIIKLPPGDPKTITERVNKGKPLDTLTDIGW